MSKNSIYQATYKKVTVEVNFPWDEDLRLSAKTKRNLQANLLRKINLKVPPSEPWFGKLIYARPRSNPQGFLIYVASESHPEIASFTFSVDGNLIESSWSLQDDAGTEHELEADFDSIEGFTTKETRVEDSFDSREARDSHFTNPLFLDRCKYYLDAFEDDLYQEALTFHSADKQPGETDAVNLTVTTDQEMENSFLTQMQALEKLIEAQFSKIKIANLMAASSGRQIYRAEEEDLERLLIARRDKLRQELKVKYTETLNEMNAPAVLALELQKELRGFLTAIYSHDPRFTHDEDAESLYKKLEKPNKSLYELVINQDEVMKDLNLVKTQKDLIKFMNSYVEADEKVKAWIELKSKNIATMQEYNQLLVDYVSEHKEPIKYKLPREVVFVLKDTKYLGGPMEVAELEAYKEAYKKASVRCGLTMNLIGMHGVSVHPYPMLETLLQSFNYLLKLTRDQMSVLFTAHQEKSLAEMDAAINLIKVDIMKIPDRFQGAVARVLVTIDPTLELNLEFYHPRVKRDVSDAVVKSVKKSAIDVRKIAIEQDLILKGFSHADRKAQIPLIATRLNSEVREGDKSEIDIEAYINLQKVETERHRYDCKRLSMEYAKRTSREALLKRKKPLGLDEKDALAEFDTFYNSFLLKYEHQTKSLNNQIREIYAELEKAVQEGLAEFEKRGANLKEFSREDIDALINLPSMIVLHHMLEEKLKARDSLAQEILQGQTIAEGMRRKKAALNLDLLYLKRKIYTLKSIIYVEGDEKYGVKSHPEEYYQDNQSLTSSDEAKSMLDRFEKDYEQVVRCSEDVAKPDITLQQVKNQQQLFDFHLQKLEELSQSYEAFQKREDKKILKMNDAVSAKLDSQLREDINKGYPFLLSIVRNPKELGLKSKNYNKYTGMKRIIAYIDKNPLPQDDVSAMKVHVMALSEIAKERLSQRLYFWKRDPAMKKFYECLAKFANDELVTPRNWNYFIQQITMYVAQIEHEKTHPNKKFEDVKSHPKNPEKKSKTKQS